MRGSVLLVTVVLTAASPASAQLKPGSADEKEIAAYELSMPVLKKVEAAMTNMAAAMKNDPRYARQQKLQQEIDALEKQDELSEAESERLAKLQAELEELEQSADESLLKGGTLNEMEARIDAHPVFSKALSSAGLPAREYVKFLGAFLQASMVHGLQKAGTIKELPNDINLANVKFIEAHEAEIQEFGRRMEALGRK